MSENPLAITAAELWLVLGFVLSLLVIGHALLRLARREWSGGSATTVSFVALLPWIGAIAALLLSMLLMRRQRASGLTTRT